MTDLPNLTRLAEEAERISQLYPDLADRIQAILDNFVRTIASEIARPGSPS